MTRTSILVSPVQLTAFPWGGRAFTEGALYSAKPGPGTLWQVVDNLGHLRYIALDGKPCPHLVSRSAPWGHQLLGRWNAEHIVCHD